MSSDSHRAEVENARERYSSVSQSEAKDRSSRRNEHDRMYTLVGYSCSMIDHTRSTCI